MKDNRIVIGFDLDSTLIESLATEMAAKDLSLGFSQKDVTDWQYSNFEPKFSKRVFERFVCPECMCHLPKPLPGAQELLEELNKEGFYIVIITARGEDLIEETVKMINRYFPSVQDINFCGLGKPKASIMKAKNLDFWVDDAPHGVEEALALNIPTYMISNNYTKYNWDLNYQLHYNKAPHFKKSVKNLSELSFLHFI